MLLLTLRGTPTLYNGDELGLPDASISPAEIQDPAELRQPGLGLGRDPERSPMPWDWQENAGFTAPGVRTWLPLVPNWPAFTVQGESENPQSMLSLYRTLLALRREHSALSDGPISNVSSTAAVLSYTRSSPSQTFQIHLNLTGQYQPIQLPHVLLTLTSYLDQRNVSLYDGYALRPNEAILVEAFALD